MLRQQRLTSRVSLRATSLRLMMSTDAVPDNSSRLNTPTSLTVVPSGQLGSDRTWNACHGISFASSRDNTPSQTVSHLIHGRPSHTASLPKDTSTKRPVHLLETQLQFVSRSSNENENEDGQSPKSVHCGSYSPSDAETFRSPLGFHIPESKLRYALLAEPTSIESFWHFTLYQGPGGDKDKVKVHYCKSKETTERVAQMFLDQKVVGFDIEWKPSSTASDGITKNVALIQIANEERVLLAHIARYPGATSSEKEQRVEDFVAPSLKKIMESSSISKVGVAIKADCTRLRKFLDIDSHGLFELSHLYKLVKFSSGDVKKINKMPVSLAQQVQEHLQLPLAKGDVRTCDWSKSQDLDYEQTRYAASDTYAALQLYYILEAKRKALGPTPPRPAHAELNIPIRLADGQTIEPVDDPAEPIQESAPLEDDFQKLTIEDSAPSYPQLPASPAPSSSPPSSSSSSSSQTSRPPLPSKSVPTAPPKPEDLTPEILEANASFTKYILTRPSALQNTKPNRTHLRAHHLWQQRSLEPAAIAALLRVNLSTVAVYVLQAIRTEYFPFDERRARALVPLTPKVLRESFEMMVRKRCEAGGGGGKENSDPKQ